MSTKFYKYSNKADFNKMPLMVIISLFAIFILGIVYNYLCIWLPIVYLNIVTTLFYGFCVGIANLAIIKVCNIRNRSLMFIIGMILSVITVYFSWVTFAMTRTELGFKDGFKLLFQGAELLRLLPQWAQEKTFTFTKNPLGSDSVNFYSLVWICEAILICFMTEFFTYFMTKRYVFCEGCHKWCEGDFELKISDKAITELTSSADVKEQNRCLKQALIVGNFTTLLKADTIENKGDESYLEFSVNYCTECNELAVISIDRHVVEITNEKAFKQDFKHKLEKDYAIISSLLIPMAITEQLMAKNSQKSN